MEESAQADLLVHVVDGADPDPAGQIRAVREVLADIGAGDVAELIVINKADLAVRRGAGRHCATAYPDAVVVSARTGRGIERLRTVIETRLPRPEVEMRALVPYERGRPDQPDPPVR